MNVCTCVVYDACIWITACVCGGQRLTLAVFLDRSSTFYFETGIFIIESGSLVFASHALGLQASATPIQTSPLGLQSKALSLSGLPRRPTLFLRIESLIG